MHGRDGPNTRLQIEKTTVLTVSKGQLRTHRPVLCRNPFPAPGEDGDTEAIAAWVFHRSDLLCELWSFHIPESPPGEDICTLLSLVKFETGGLGVPIQFYNFEKNMLEETSETQIPAIMMTLCATCPGQLLRRSSARCWKMRRRNSDLPKPKQRRLANALRRRRRLRPLLVPSSLRYKDNVF